MVTIYCRKIAEYWVNIWYLNSKITAFFLIRIVLKFTEPFHLWEITEISDNNLLSKNC